MSTFYEGEPVQKLEQQLTQPDFETAFLSYEHSISPLHRPAVRAGICVTAAVLFGSMIPWYAARFATVWFPLCGILLTLALAVYFCREQPKAVRRWAGNLFRSNRMLSLPCSVAVYRDSVAVKNEYETLTLYWTDYGACLEIGQYVILSGGLSRNFLILKKQGLTGEQQAALSAHFRNTFAARYRRR